MAEQLKQYHVRLKTTGEDKWIMLTEQEAMRMQYQHGCPYVFMMD